MDDAAALNRWSPLMKDNQFEYKDVAVLATLAAIAAVAQLPVNFLREQAYPPGETHDKTADGMVL